LRCGAGRVVFIYRQLDSDFLPDFDEGGFVIDYWAPPGTSLTETSRQLDEAEKILSANPDVEGYSRRLGAEMGMFITEPYRGDFAVKLKRDRKHSTDEVIAGIAPHVHRTISGVPLGFSRHPDRRDRRFATDARPGGNKIYFRPT
jgi:multidrug efflux pump subunit AcrB